MHWLDTSHPFPPLPFGTARIWDMGVTWADLQPQRSTPLSGRNPVVARLDSIVDNFVGHHVDPVLTLGMTPEWAARRCAHFKLHIEWGVKTCAPADTDASSPWTKYVAFLCSRYRGRIQRYELWNEPSLANGYNDSAATLARLQATTLAVVHNCGAKLISPGIPFTNGPPSNGQAWLRKFLAAPGGTSYDITGFHLYPADAAVRGGFGPEWSVETALKTGRAALEAAGVGDRPIWNTETNVGRAPAHTGYRDAAAGAAAVARTFVLAAANNIGSTLWYGADDRNWGGTWLETADYRGLSAGGVGYVTVYRQIVDTLPLGCRHSGSGARAQWTCGFGRGDRQPKLLVAWTTGMKGTLAAPAGTSGYTSVLGAAHTVNPGDALPITAEPIYIHGSFTNW